MILENSKINFPRLRNEFRYHAEQQGKTLKSLSQDLGVTEAGFKRMFDNESLKLSTYYRLCQLLKISPFTIIGN